MEKITKDLELIKNAPSRVSVEELEKIKVVFATHYNFEVDSDNAFVRTSEEWLEMEKALDNCRIAVFHNYKGQNWEAPGVVFFFLAQHLEDNFQVWACEGSDISKLKLVPQAMDM